MLQLTTGCYHIICYYDSKECFTYTANTLDFTELVWHKQQAV